MRIVATLLIAAAFLAVAPVDAAPAKDECKPTFSEAKHEVPSVAGRPKLFIVEDKATKTSFLYEDGGSDVTDGKLRRSDAGHDDTCKGKVGADTVQMQWRTF